MKYSLQEGSFSLFSAAWQDATINILRDKESGLSLVISRGPVPDESDFEKEFHRQWETLRTQMGDVHQSAFERVSVGPENSIRAVEVETAFTRNGQQLWQKQLALLRWSRIRLPVISMRFRNIWRKAPGAYLLTASPPDARKIAPPVKQPSPIKSRLM